MTIKVYAVRTLTLEVDSSIAASYYYSDWAYAGQSAAVNGDGIIDKTDATLTALYTIDINYITELSTNFILKAGDINIDNKIKMNDAMRILSKNISHQVESNERIHFISGASEKEGVGSNDAILIESNGSFAMVDTGSSSWNQIDGYLQLRNVNTLEYILLTHMHSDHAGNIDKIISKYIVKNIYMKKYCKNETGENNSDYDNLYNCSQYDLTLNDNCSLASSRATDDDLEQTLRWYKRTKCLIDKYNQQNPNNMITLNYINKKGAIINDIKPSNFNSTLTLYQQKLVSETTANSSENYNTIIALYKSPKGHLALLTGDAYDTSALNTTVETIRSKYSNKETLFDVLKMPHHGGGHCAMLTKDDTETTIKLSKDVKYYVITNSTTLLAENGAKYERCRCVDLFATPTGGIKHYTDECMYDKETDTFNIGAVIADFNGDNAKMIDYGKRENCQVGDVEKKDNCKVW